MAESDGINGLAKSPSLLELGSEPETTPSNDAEFQGEEQWLNALPSDQRYVFCRNIVRRTIRTHGENGLTVPELQALTKLSYSTVAKHLEGLCRLREVYKTKRSKNVVMYYPNGIPLHRIERERIDAPEADTILDLTVAQGRQERLFLHLTERRFSLLEGETVEGAVMFPMERLTELIDKLRKLEEKVKGG